MNIRNKIKDAIKAKLEMEVAKLDMDEIILAAAESIIDDEIGDIELAAQEFIEEEAGDYRGEFGAKDTLHEILTSQL